MAQTLSHTAVLQASADKLWESCKHVDRIFCDLLPEYFTNVEFLQGDGELGSMCLVTTGPEIKHALFLKERVDKFDDATKTLGYTVLEGDSRYSAFSTEIQFVAKDAAVTEATWTATFVPVGDMGPPEHIKAVAELVFQTLEKAVHMKKMFIHTETLDVSPDALWNACLHADEILLEQMPQHFASSTVVEDYLGPGTVREFKFGPAVLKGDPRYKYFAANMLFSAGPSAGSTYAEWEATFLPAGDMGPPEHVRDVVMSVWKALTAAAKANPEHCA